MLQRLGHRGGHYLLLTLAWAALSLPGLGAPALWDIDEGNNATAACEMLRSGNPLVPTFNYQLRVDKPALLYWLQMTADWLGGVDEFAARLPSALAALGAVLVTYELGRRTFGAAAGLLAGLMLAGAALFVGAARFANPDALLNLFTLLALYAFWRGYRKGGPLPFGAAGAAAGLGMLAKGPVALVLPLAVTVLFLAWQRELRRLVDPRVGRGVLAFLLVAAPWYTWVGVETKGEWLKGFFLTHNVGRALQPMEHHDGPFWYYAAVLLAGFAPWSVFFGPAAWSARSDAAGGRTRAATRFLACWIAVYFVFFTFVRTKLPNYILPTYPAVALLTARYLDRWRRGAVTPPAWMTRGSLACLALTGVGTAAGLLIASGAVPAGVPPHRQLPALASLAPLGALPLAGALAGAWFARRDSRPGVLAAVGLSGLLFCAGLAAFGPVAVDRYKAPRALAAALPRDQLLRDVRIGCYDYFRPSLVFYCRREVCSVGAEESVRDFLGGPLPAYVFLPADAWEWLRESTPAREVARHFDLYSGRDVVLVTNE